MCFSNSTSHTTPERSRDIFFQKTLYSTGDYISESCKSSRLHLFPRVTGRIDKESRACSLCEPPLSLLPALNEKIWDGGIHWGGFRSPTIAMVSQLRHLLTDREKATEPTDGSKSLLLHNLAMTLVIEHFLCTSEIHYFLESTFKK